MKKILFFLFILLFLNFNSALAAPVTDNVSHSSYIKYTVINGNNYTDTDLQIQYYSSIEGYTYFGLPAVEPQILINTYDSNGQLLNTYDNNSFAYYSASSLAKHYQAPDITYNSIEIISDTPFKIGGSGNLSFKAFPNFIIDEPTVYYDPDYVTYSLSNPNDLSFLDTLNPSPGFNEYIVYETSWGSTYAEYYRTFPQVTFVSDSDTSDDFQKWKITGNGDREVYYFFDLDPPYWELWDKSYNTEFTGYSTNAEIKIISSSQQLTDNANNTYGGYPNGNIEDAPLPTYQEDEVFVNITSPKNGTETVKTSTILEVYYNAPSEYVPDGFFQDTKYATVPEVWLKSNYINNPNNNNGYLPYLSSNIYYAQNDIDYDSASQNNNGDYTLLGVTSKYTGQGRTEYVLRMQVNLGVNINDFTVTVKPTFIDFDSGLTSSKYQMNDIVKNFSVTRLTSVDTNNDGIDDTTGEDINNSNPYDGSIINDNGSTPIVSDGNFSQLDSLDIETGLLDIFSNITNFVSVYISSIGQMFTFLPPQIISIIVFSLSVGALIGFFKLIRG
jgi:hypothetical protein